MEPIDQLDRILGAVSDVVDGIAAEQLAAPTPCDEFTVHDVLDHMMVLGGAFAHLFLGEEPTGEPAPPAYGRVPAAEFRRAMDDLLDGVRSDGAMERTLDTPIGQLPGESFARVVAFDGLVHGWDLAVATGQRYPIDDELVREVDAFARAALSDELRQNGMFGAATTAPPDASAIEELAAFTGRTVDATWRLASRAITVPGESIPRKVDVPGAVARQARSFGSVAGFDEMAGEYFSLGAGTDIAPLLEGLPHDACDAPHWGYMVSGAVTVTFVDGSETTSRAGELFYWPPGHSVRVIDDTDVVLFSPAHEHEVVLDHMLDRMAAAG